MLSVYVWFGALCFDCVLMWFVLVGLCVEFVACTFLCGFVLVCFDTLSCWGLCLRCSFVLGVSCFACYFTGLLVVLLHRCSEDIVCV